jgi:probable HAF family extracellular repeat protein
MRRFKCVAAIAVCTGAMSVSPAGAELQLVFTTLEVLGAVSTNAQGINARGDVVGIYTDTSGLNHGFLWSGGEFATIDVPEARVTAARAIGPNGEIVGTYQRVGESGNIPSHGFLLTAQGKFLSMDFPGHANTIPQRILADGTVLGCYHDADLMASMHGMMMSRDGVAELPEGMSMHNGATPDGKLIVGLYTDMMDGRGKGYLYEGGTLTPLEVPGSASTAAWDINPAGVVVGVFINAAGAHGFTFDGAQFSRIDVPGATATRVFGINPRGDIVGAYVEGGFTRAFIGRWTSAD